MYQFMPLHTHYDAGYGATADAFKEAADRLVTILEESSFLYADLPICFLYRHAAELYLKSMILVIHRRLNLPYGDASDPTQPKIKIGDKFKFISQVLWHLYQYLKILVKNHKERVNSFGQTDWDTFPSELDTWIEKIDEGDTRSTFFRYPSPPEPYADMDKSEFREVSSAEILERMRGATKPLKLYVDGNSRTFLYEGTRLDEIRSALKGAADLLSGAHFGMRMTIAGGE